MKRLLTLLAAVLAVCATPAPATNTLVRFSYYHGTVTVGSMDVELFDQDKPVTVSNFLNYVRSGAYDNLMLHRLVPGFVMQGGAVRTLTPLSTAQFAGYLNTPDFGPIRNEFDTGPRYSNIIGTLAMARAVPGGSDTNFTHEQRVQATNSASTDWFINLADNSGTLDTNWGGFTVFGRVVGATNMLGFFNRTNSMLGILEMDWLWYPGLTQFASVPVAYPALYPFPRMPPYPRLPRFPRYSDLYHVRIAEMPASDIRRPTVAVTYPAAGAKLTNPVVTITGTATDNVGIRSIWYSVAGRDFTNVAAGNEWSVTTDIAAGTNYLYVQSVDTSGQRSPMLIRNFFHSVPEPLRLTNVGNGTISGAINGQRFEIGRIVSLTAKPAPGHLFAGWSGTYDYDLPTLRFFMSSNAALTATFVTNPFAPMKGTYAGLFFNTNQPNQPSGLLSFNVTELGKVTGKLNVLGRTLPFSGALSPYGEGNIRIPAGVVASSFGTQADWFLVCSIDVTNRTDRVIASSASGTGYPYIWDPNTFNSAVVAHRVHPGTLANPSPYAGKYTLAIAPGTNSSTQPGGWSHGAATVNAAGTATFAGMLADGSPFTQSAPVFAANGMWPFYSGLYAGRGWMSGWLQMHLGQPAGDISGSMRWRKLGPVVGPAYRNGFDLRPELIGSRYTPATLTNRVLDFSDGILSLTGPNLAAPITNQIALEVNNTVRNLDTNRLTYTLVKGNGLFSGTVRPVGESRTVTYKGAVLQTQGTQGYGVGYYLSTNLSGSVYFGP